MSPDNLATCTYRHHVDGKYSMELHFASMEAAKTAALSLLRFLGLESQAETQQEAPPHKITEEVTKGPDPLTTLQENEAEFADHLRTYRFSHGYSQKKLADLLGVSQTTICWWERRMQHPCEETKQAILKKLESGDFSD